MVNEEIRQYVERPEGHYFDRKSGRIQPRDFAPHLVAFANADGGTIVVGLENDGRVTGMARHEARESQLIRASPDYSPGIDVRR